ncbi:pirin family protein [[Clostridium] fimetarium]|uniref:Pirin N-terminal domain-containing protein n=1 Tax=[Clostridium] fimetarium TaxID=99656 RepID=A0A1I0RPM9_9FIRM|nr:pirin family protein [[Clostridium] fimetarium]SEW43254.1 hypothetical protein SAMN05421659_12050 [[Clostridium] fimetarium]
MKSDLMKVFGYYDVQEFDPFLMLDVFDSTNPDDYTKGFPWHPHRGIETVTYLIKGDIEHGDSLGNKGSILDADGQWMTAGSGIIHQELPKKSDRMLGAQLWLNLPAQYKMVDLQYGDILKKDVPIVEGDGSLVHIISGSYKGISGAFQGEYVKSTYLDVELEAGAEWTMDTDKASTLFVYIFQGEGSFGQETDDFVSEKHAILFNEGDTLKVNESDNGMRFILLMGKPLGEPIAWGGPIVMNTKEELELAFAEIDSDIFIKHERK